MHLANLQPILYFSVLYFKIYSIRCENEKFWGLRITGFLNFMFAYDLNQFRECKFEVFWLKQLQMLF